MVLVSDLLREVVTNLEINLNFYSVQLSGDNFECRTLNTHWLNKCAVITLGGVNYEVISFELNKSLILKGNSAPLENTNYPLDNPFFINGKLKQVNAEILQNGQVSYPLIWMFELSPRTVPQEVDTVIESTGSVRLFIMNTDDYANLNTFDRDKEIINPVQNLVTLLVKALKRNKRTGKVFVNQNIAHHKFTNDNGDTAGTGSNWLPENLSGVELDILIPIKRGFICPVKEIPTAEGAAFDSSFNSSFDID